MRRGLIALAALLSLAAVAGFAAILIASLPPADLRVTTAPMAVSDALAPEAAIYDNAPVDAEYGAGAAYRARYIPRQRKTESQPF